jgi:hypothetical protein
VAVPILGPVSPLVAAAGATEVLAAAPEALQKIGQGALSVAQAARQAVSNPAQRRREIDIGLGIAALAGAGFFLLRRRPSVPTTTPVTGPSKTVQVTPPTPSTPYAPSLPIPGAPTVLTQVAATPTSVTLTVSPVEGAVAYNAYNFTNNTLMGSSTNNTITITDLLPGQHYSVYVRAVNANGVEGTPSEVTLVATPPLVSTPTTPPQPLPPVVVSTSPDRVTLILRGVPGATSYEIIDAQTQAVYRTGLEAGVPVTISGLQPGNSYQFASVAVNQVGASNPSSPTTVTLPRQAVRSTPKPPGPPTLVRTEAQSAVSASLTIQWPASQDATYYQVLHAGQVIATSTTTQATIQGLVPGGIETLSISACNQNGCSVPGPSTSFRVASFEAHPAPQIPAPPTGLHVVGSQAVSQHNATLSIAWNVSPGATYYQIVHRTGEVIGHTSDTHFVIEQLAPNATETVAVRACNEAGCSALTPFIEGHTASYHAPAQATQAIPAMPGPPRMLSAVVAPNGTVTLNLIWNAVPNANHYEVWHANGQRLLVSDTTSASLAGLPAGSTLTVAVRACNNAGCSSLGPSSSFVLPKPQASVVMTRPSSQIVQTPPPNPAPTAQQIRQQSIPPAPPQISAPPTRPVIQPIPTPQQSRAVQFGPPAPSPTPVPPSMVQPVRTPTSPPPVIQPIPTPQQSRAMQFGPLVSTPIPTVAPSPRPISPAPTTVPRPIVAPIPTPQQSRTMQFGPPAPTTRQPTTQQIRQQVLQQRIVRPGARPVLSAF